MDGCCEDHPNVTVDDEEDDDDPLLPKPIEGDEAPPPVLSLHLKCVSHTLSLIATTDVQKAITGQLHKPFAKTNKLWSLSGKPGKSLVIKNNLGVQLKLPTVVRWNSLWDALNLLLQHKEQLNTVMIALGLPNFTSFDFEVFEEYLTIMAPIALALDRMQAEKKWTDAKESLYGIVIPTLMKIDNDLVNVASKSLKHCTSLHSRAVSGLHKRFGDHLHLNLDCDSVKFAVLATVSNPRFKLHFLTASSRTAKPEVEKKCKDVLLNAAKKYTFEATDSKFSITSTTDNADYYGFKIKGSSGKSATSSEIDVIKYLEDSSDKLGMLLKYPSVRNVFVRFNTALPSSAPVERMFSLAGKIHSPSRTQLTSENFRKLVLMKANFHV